jgi:hydroxyacylglutathione hydrolase
MITVDAIPAFVDNYFWLLVRGRKAAVVDPGDAEPVRQALRSLGLELSAILITHHHGDHIGGVQDLLRDRRVPVFGPRAEQKQIPFIDHPLGDGDRVALPELDVEFEILAVPGHTLGHIAYYAAARGTEPGVLFCGDTLFVAGCGRLFEGTAAQMHASLERLAALPADTRVYCAHEYTLANLAFARAVEPDRAELAQEIERVRELRGQQVPSVPSTIAREMRFNPFLRSTEPTVRASVEAHGETELDTATKVFAALRRWKDGFRPPAT